MRRTEKQARQCSQEGCPGDGRYQPPGRGHFLDCKHDAVSWVWGEVEFRHPPEGWDTFGTNVEHPGPIEFSTELDAAGMPLWERRISDGDAPHVHGDAQG